MVEKNTNKITTRVLMKPAIKQDKIFSTNFWLRLLTGFGLVILITNCVVYGPYSLIALVLLINIFGLNEFYALF